jgi:hypothetical protein
MGLVLQSHIYEGGVLVAGVFLACHAIFIVVGVWKLFDGLMGHLAMFLALCFGGLRSHVCHERQKELYLCQWKKAGNKQSQVTHQKPSIIRS